jgi:putative ABC transport system permease protein
MKFLPLVWAMLWRSKTRTWLTFLSIAVAFLLFALLKTVESGFFQGVRLAGDDRLIVTYRQGLTQVLPLAYLSRIETVKGVRAVTPIFPFGAIYQDPKQQVQGAALDPMRVTEVNPAIALPPEQLKAFQTVRTGAIVGRALAEKYGWKTGDRVPLTLPVHRKDGTQHWEFEIVGIFENDARQLGREVPAEFMLVNYAYWNEAVQFPNFVPWYTVRVHDPARAAEVGRAIDRLFANSQFETKTQRERDFQAAFLRQIGDIGAVFAAILAAVFFTLILVAGNAMMQAFRERIPELGVLKTLGFSNGQLAVIVTAEAMVLCLAAGAAGLSLAALAAGGLKQIAVQGLPMPGLEAATVTAGAALAAALGVLAALIPAWKSARLTVTDALAEQN